MNTLRNNHNIRRFGLSLVATVALGGTACAASEQNPTPPPPPPNEGVLTPSCSIDADVDGRVVTPKIVDIQNEYRPGVYTVERTEFDYGDGTVSAGGPHTYDKPGPHTIKAGLIMDVAPGAEGEAPFSDGFKAPCLPPLTVAIE